MLITEKRLNNIIKQAIKESVLDGLPQEYQVYGSNLENFLRAENQLAMVLRTYYDNPATKPYATNMYQHLNEITDMFLSNEFRNAIQKRGI